MSERRKLNKYDHVLSRKGYFGLQQEIVRLTTFIDEFFVMFGIYFIMILKI